MAVEVPEARSGGMVGWRWRFRKKRQPGVACRPFQVLPFVTSIWVAFFVTLSGVESWPPFWVIQKVTWKKLVDSFFLFDLFVWVLGAAFRSRKGKLLGLFRPSWYDTVDGRNPANQLRLVVYPTIPKVLYITVVQDFFHQQYNSVFYFVDVFFSNFDILIIWYCHFKFFFWYISDKLWFLFIVWRGSFGSCDLRCPFRSVQNNHCAFQFVYKALHWKVSQNVKIVYIITLLLENKKDVCN